MLYFSMEEKIMKKRIFALFISAVLLISMMPSVSGAQALAMGDADGDGFVEAADARFTLRCSVGLEIPSLEQLAALDTNKDGKLTAKDARKVLRVSVGLESFFNSLKIYIGSGADTLDPALNSAIEGATIINHLFSGLAKWSQDESGKLVIVPDCAENLSEGVKNKDGTVTYTYTLKKGLKWSDGKPVTASDFVYAWNRAASPELYADYNFIFEIIDGYYDMWDLDYYGNPLNPDAKLNVKAKDDRTLVVTLANDAPYWNELLAFPAFFPVRKDVVSNELWASAPKTLICNGPFTASEWKNGSIILKKNPDYIDADKVTVDELQFIINADAYEMVDAYRNGDIDFNEVIPYEMTEDISSAFPDEFKTVGVMGTYYACWNINEEILPAGNTLKGVKAEKARAEIRRALSLLIDRSFIAEAVGGGQLPASSFVAMGLTNPDGSEFYQTAGSSEDSYYGYFDPSKEAYESNVSRAVEILKKYYKYNASTGKFTNFPVIDYMFNDSAGHRMIGEIIASDLAKVGITVTLTETDWNTFLYTRMEGEFTLARNGWIADYNDPVSFLDMWTTSSFNNDVQFGRAAHKDVAAYSLDLTKYGYNIKVANGTWAETYDVLIKTIKECKDIETRNALSHLAEDMLMDTGCIIPIYFYTDIFLIDEELDGFYANPLGYKYFMNCN